MNTNDKMLHDSAVSAQTPEGIEFILYPAGPLVRICALGIDTVLQWLLMIIGTLITDIWEGSGGWIMLLTGFALNWLYFTAWEIFYQGQTLGKRVMGIRVVQGNGSPVSPAASFIRNLLRFADTFFYLYAIGLMCAAASPGFRRIGDWAADTLVVYTARGP